LETTQSILVTVSVETWKLLSEASLDTLKSYYVLDSSAAPTPLFRLARTKSGWRAGAPTKIRLATAGDFSGGGGGEIRRDLVNGGTSHY